jgi:hypothetical protein
MLTCDHHQITLSVRIEKKSICTLTEPVNYLMTVTEPVNYQGDITEPVNYRVNWTFTPHLNDVTYELRSNILIILLLDRIRTQDLVSRPLGLRQFYHCTIEAHSTTISLVNIYLIFWDTAIRLCRSVIELTALHVCWVPVAGPLWAEKEQGCRAWCMSTGKWDTSPGGIEQ